MKRKLIITISLIVACMVVSLLLTGCGLLGVGDSDGSDGNGQGGNSETEQTRGTVWFDGTAEPSAEELTDAVNGDYYLRVFSDFSGKKRFCYLQVKRRHLDVARRYVNGTV